MNYPWIADGDKQFISGLDQGASLSGSLERTNGYAILYRSMIMNVYYDKTFINKMYKWAK